MMRQSEYAKRREAFGNKLKPNSVAVFLAAKPKIRSNDTEYPYRQNSNFYYLTGFKEQNAALLFVKRKTKCHTFLFVQEKDPKAEMWSGQRIGVKRAKSLFEGDDVFAIDTLRKKLQNYEASHRFYYDFQEEYNRIKPLKKAIRSVRSIKDGGRIVEAMRLFKSPAEIEMIKKAIAITAKAHHEAMRFSKHFRFEYELQARFEYIFKKNGALSDAYPSIIAGGDNGNTLHYIANNQRLCKEELVLIDAGCEYEYYASDITRTIPVRGKFSKAQKELYELVLRVEKKIISLIKPGVLRSELQQLSERMLCEGMVQYGILRGSVEKLLKKQKHKRYFPHSIGHYMGLDVHDKNPYKDKKGKEIPLQAGMVLTIEPGIYLPKEDKSIPRKYRGIAIRIEDNILVTQDGHENLSQKIAKEIEEIESYAS